MSGGLVKHSVVISGHRTSVSLEPEFWQALQALAQARGNSVNTEIGLIDANRGMANLSSAIRLAILADYKSRLDPQGAGEA
jgi:predicted DNA-binding ribbon-helix-helix protein